MRRFRVKLSLVLITQNADEIYIKRTQIYYKYLQCQQHFVIRKLFKLTLAT